MKKEPVDILMKNFRAKRKAKRRFYSALFILLFLCWYILVLPTKLFNDPTSTVLLDRNGELLGARIADDGQWRFAPSDSVPEKFKRCIVEFEDRDFYWHVGVSGKGIGRALWQNMHNGKRVSGGSTITMQLVRIMKKNPPRTYGQKIYEMILATRIEWSYSKDEILNMYASNAPFGNNVVGLDAAAWRYFGRAAYQLSWAETATLAVLPNAPGLIYPGKNQEKLLAKRNRLLTHLHDEGFIADEAYQLAITEPLPLKPLPLPQLAPHLLEKMILSGKKGQTIQSSLVASTQRSIQRSLELHSLVLKDNKVFNGAVIVTEVKTGEVVAYVGNTTVEDEEFSSYVDCADAPRSSGSILKPFLYCAALEEGNITPSMLVTDVPTQFGSFSPKNFSGHFEGAIPVNKALSRSLNVPMVHLLKEFGVTRFHKELKKLGISTLNKPSKHYGLSLILGGAETKLSDLSAAYCQLAQRLECGRNKGFWLTKTHPLFSEQLPSNWSKAAIYSTFEALTEVNRPDEDNNWKLFASSRKIAWKTGTSFGFRDAWSIGVTPDYVVAVWIGNADGEGRPGLTGVKAAAPLMFDVFRQLPNSGKWFRQPINEMKAVGVCSLSGYKAGRYCENVRGELIPKRSKLPKTCPFHQQIHLDKSDSFRVDSDCESVFNMQHRNWFVLPALMEKYYKINHPNYVVLPPYRADCLAGVKDKSFTIVYPRQDSRLYIPIQLDETFGKTIFEVSHRNTNAHVYWHLDKNFLGITSDVHQIAVNPSKGKHELTVVDEFGVSQTIRFEVIRK